VADPPNELEALRTQIAALTARVYQLELARELPSKPVSAPVPQPVKPELTSTYSTPALHRPASTRHPERLSRFLAAEKAIWKKRSDSIG
jgi:hypothetical protein